MKKINTDFSYGEISTKFDGRADLPYYTKGCSELRNMYVMPQGVAGRIGGTNLVTVLKTVSVTSDDRSGVIAPFYFDETHNGVIVFVQAGTSGYIDWYVVDGNSKNVTMGTSIQWSADLSDVQWAQVDKSLIFTNPTAKPLKFTWVGNTRLLQAFTTTGTQFDTAGNYPAACTFFAGRLIFAGTTAHPDYVWASKTFSPSDFNPQNTNDDQSWSTQITTSDFNKVLWVAPKDEGIAVGTSTTETLITGGDNGLTPTALQQRKLSSYGSSHTDPIQIGLSTVFVQPDERRMRELAYTDANGALYSPDITMLADHLTESGIKRMTYQLEPFEAIFVLRYDGKVAMLTYDRNTGINAWSLLDLGCEVHDLCTVGNRVMFLSKRGTQLCIEQLRDYDETFHLMWASSYKYFTTYFSDTYATFSITGGKVKATTTNAHNLALVSKIMVAKYDDTPISEYKFEWIDSTNIYLKDMDGNYVTELPNGLNVLNGAYIYPVAKYFHLWLSNNTPLITGVELDVVADDTKYVGRLTPDNDGKITLPYEAWKVTVGYHFTSHMRTMRLMQDAIGNPVGRINKVYLRLWKSLGCKIGQTMEDSEEITFRDGELDLGTPALYTGDKEHTMLTEYTTEGHFYVWTDDVYPLNISAMAVDFRAGGQRK